MRLVPSFFILFTIHLSLTDSSHAPIEQNDVNIWGGICLVEDLQVFPIFSFLTLWHSLKSQTPSVSRSVSEKPLLLDRTCAWRAVTKANMISVMITMNQQFRASIDKEVLSYSHKITSTSIISSQNLNSYDFPEQLFSKFRQKFSRK